VSATVLHMSISLDGFVAGPNEGPDNPTGDGGYRLHSWFLTSADGDDFKKVSMGGVNGQAYAELMATGAVVAGRGTFEPAAGWDGDHHDGVPIFIYSRQEPGIDISQWPLVTYLCDLETAMTKAREAAGENSSSMSSRCSSARVADCSTTSIQNRSSLSAPGSSRGERCHPHALPGPALTTMFPRVAFPGRIAVSRAACRLDRSGECAQTVLARPRSTALA
jgi:dihydrofolate reductase